MYILNEVRTLKSLQAAVGLKGFFIEHVTYEVNEVSEHKSLCEIIPSPKGEG